MVRDPDMSLDQLETNVTTDVSRDGDGVAEYAEEFTQLHPRGEAELRELQSYREAEECALEEEELRKEREQEREIKERLLAEEIERDLNQEGNVLPLSAPLLHAADSPIVSYERWAEPEDR